MLISKKIKNVEKHRFKVYIKTKIKLSNVGNYQATIFLRNNDFI